MVQSVQVQTWRMVEDVCPFEICWIHDKLPALPAPHDVRCGIVSTFRDAPCLGSWLRYNLSVGIDKIYLYIDSPQHDETAAREAAGAHPGKVQLILSDAALRAAWESQVGWMRYGKYVDDTGDHSAVMARQSLNAEHAMRLAEADGLAWLAHIDVDELLHPLEGGGSVKGIFQAAEAAGAYGLSFPNHEVFPEGEGPYPDPFQSHRIFKLNEMIHPPGLETPLSCPVPTWLAAPNPPTTPCRSPQGRVAFPRVRQRQVGGQSRVRCEAGWGPQMDRPSQQGGASGPQQRVPPALC